jgi:dTDP-4-amino-4,6-dideoxygalactose transaminase
MSSAARTVVKTPAFNERFRFIKPTLPSLEAIVKTYTAAYGDSLITNGVLVQQLESAVQEFLGVRHCIAVSSCTSGLMMVMRALNLTGEVILPSFTFFATGHASVWNGLRPVFADCDPETWNISPDSVQSRVTERTSSIVAVHLYGNPCDVEALAAIAARHRLKLIFDAAHAFGSSHRLQRIGGLGDAEIFSLSPTKLLVAGEGGFVTTNDSVLARKIRAARNYGDLGAYDPEILGLSARMPEFNAALALEGLPLVDRKVKRHNQIAALYTNELAGVPGISFQVVRDGDTSTYKDYSIQIDSSVSKISRDEIASLLLEENVETKKYFYPPLHWQALYRQYDTGPPGTLRHTEHVTSRILSLPIYESLSDDMVIKVAQAVRTICESHGRR